MDLYTEWLLVGRTIGPSRAILLAAAEGSPERYDGGSSCGKLYGGWASELRPLRPPLFPPAHPHLRTRGRTAGAPRICDRRRESAPYPVASLECKDSNPSRSLPY